MSETISQNLQNSIKEVSNTIQNTANDISQATGNIRDSINNTVSDFSSKGLTGASSEFLQSNSIIAKFAFVILLLIVFVFIFSVFIQLIGYFTNKHNSPYLVYGMINGNNSLSISQDPKNSSSVTLLRSNNGVSGLEFTWSVWLFVSGIPNETKYAHVFNKGDTNWLSSGSNKGISTVNNSPGLYITKDNTNSTLSLYIQMDMDTNINEPYKSVEIKDIPLNKWFNVCIRMQNVVLDVYVNGINSGRVVLPNIPRQNYNNVNVCNNGGFNGNLSNLRYFNYALSIFDINYIAWSGPRLKSSSIGNTAYKGSNNFISDSWYFSKM